MIGAPRSIARLILPIATTAALLAGQPAIAQDVPDSLTGRTIRLIIGGSPTSETNSYGRGLLAGLEAVLPDTTIRMQNLNGGGGTLALVEAMEAREGGVLNLALSHSAPVYNQIFESNLALDLNDFHWIAALTNNQRVVAVRPALAANGFAGLAASGQLVVPVSGAQAEIEATLVGAMTPLHFSIVLDVDDELRNTLLMAGDADVAIGGYSSLKTLIDSGDLVVVMRMGETGYPPELDDVPVIADVGWPSIPPEAFALTASLNTLGRLLLAAPATSAADVEALRAAVDRAMASPETADAYARQALVLAPTQGAEVERQMDLLLGSPDARALLGAYMDCGRAEIEGAERECTR